MGYQGKKIRGLSKQFHKNLEIIKIPRKWFRVPEVMIDVMKYLEEKKHKILLRFQLLPRRWAVAMAFVRGLSVLEGVAISS